MSSEELDFISEFLDLQDEIRDYLLSKRFFFNITILSERSKELESQIGIIIANAKGLYILILVNSGKNDKPAMLGPRLEVDVTVTITEDPLVNRAATGTGKQATAIVVEVLRFLHLWKPKTADGPMEFVDFGPMPSETYLVQYLKFRTKLNIKSAADLT